MYLCVWRVDILWGLEHLHKVWSSKHKAVDFLFFFNKIVHQSVVSLWEIKAVSGLFYLFIFVGLWHGNWKLKALVLQIDCSFWVWISMFSMRLSLNASRFALQYLWEFEYHLWFIINELAVNVLAAAKCVPKTSFTTRRPEIYDVPLSLKYPTFINLDVRSGIISSQLAKKQDPTRSRGILYHSEGVYTWHALWFVVILLCEKKETVEW